MKRLVFISDTHTRHDFNIPEGDILVHCGDLTFRGTVEEISKEAQWLRGVKVGLGFSYVIVIPGNHDWLAEKDPQLMKMILSASGLTCLNHDFAEVEGIKFFGSGYTPEFCGWALGYSRYEGESLRLWSQIPDDTEVLVTHGPPKGILDLTAGYEEMTPSGIGKYQPPEHVGCWDLRERIRCLKSLKVSAFGHIHHSYGTEIIDGVRFINASTCDERYKATNQPVVVDWPLKNDPS